jgi:DNA-binding transcriptional MerR regulator
MIRKYENFLIEQDVERFCNLLEKVNEMKEMDDFLESLSVYLEDVFQKGSDYVGDFLTKVFKYFTFKRSILIFLLLVLLTRCGCTIEQVNKYLNGNETQKSKLIADVKAKYQEEQHNVEHFLKAIANRESGGDPTIVNSLGYRGKYQFGEIALKEVGLENKVKLNKFKKNPKIWPESQQDKAMKELMLKNKQHLGEYVSKYNGKKIKGITVTESGMLAGAHLLGPKNVKKFLDSNGTIDPKDGFGTRLSEYLSKFSGYKMDI